MTTSSEAGSRPEPGRIVRPKPDRDQQGALAWVPGFHMIRHYRAGWLARDLVAGLVLTAVLIPAGMAYAQACGLPPSIGLYASIFPLLAYAVFGPSRILIFGPDAALTPMIATAIIPLAAGDVGRAMTLAAALAIFSGLICVFVGVARLGFVTELLSKPIRYGYMNGIALDGARQSTAAGVRLLGRWRQPALPRVGAGRGCGEGSDELGSGGHRRGHARSGAAAQALAASARRVDRGGRGHRCNGLLHLAERAGVAVVGPLPQGLPAPAVPLVRPQDLAPLATAAVAIAAVSVAQTSVLSRAYAAKDGAYVDPNREMAGLGMANLAAGLFQGFPVNSAASRTPVAENAGARTQVAGVAGGVCVALLLIAAPNLLQNMPNAALAAVVIAAAIGLFEVRDLGRLYRMQRWEFWLSLGCFAGVVLFGAVPGIIFAIVLAVIEFLWDGWRPHHAVLGRIDGVKGYHDIARHPEARRVPGLVLFRWDAPLFFANSEQFRTSVLDAVDESPTPVRWLVVTAEPVTSVDITAADMLDRLHEELQAAQVRVCFAAMKGPVKDKLKRFGLFDKFGDAFFFRTVGEAVNAYVHAEQVNWVDWEERGVAEVGRRQPALPYPPA